ATEPGLAVVHLRGAGPKGFCAGVDVADHTSDRIRPMLEAFHRVFRVLNRMDPVSVAEVHGACLGGGLELAALCEFAIASAAAKSRPVLAITKRALRACHPGAFEKSLAEAERLYLEELVATEDMAEGMAAFLAKRRPVWQHR